MNLSNQIINCFISKELRLFKEQFGRTIVTDIQDIRGLSIAWMCYFFENNISDENALAIIEFVDKVQAREDYNEKCWYRIPALQAAAFIFTSKIFYADKLVCNVGCIQSWAKGLIIQSAGIICPLLSFNNKYLRKSVELNIENHQQYWEASILLYLNARGSTKEKEIWIEQQLHLYEGGSRDEFLKTIKLSSHYEECMFINAWNRVKSYIIFKLLSEPLIVNSQPTLFGEHEIDLSELIQKDNSHPLNTCLFNINNMK